MARLGERRDACKVLVGKPVVRRPLAENIGIELIMLYKS